MNETKENKEETAASPLMEMSKEELVAAYEALFSSVVLTTEADAYSLAQPSPYRFVPSMLSNNSGT